MDLFNDVKTPVTANNVRAMARLCFADSFEKLYAVTPPLKWLEFDVNNPDSIGTDRAVYRSLRRSEHNRLLSVGWYAPGPASEQPEERVAAHLHADPCEVRFYRIVQGKNGSRSLEDVNSTSAVDFDPPFCDVGDGHGDHRAGHRVTALIEWFFLDAGLVPELARPELDPAKFTKNFRHACSWVANGGRQPSELHTRRSSNFSIHTEEKETIPVRPKRASTAANLRHITTDDLQPPPIKRSVTDQSPIKRQRDEETASRPSKHRRTLSEQITPMSVNTLKYSGSTPPSPRTPTLSDAERINRALGLRIMHLHGQYCSLKSDFQLVDKQQKELRRELEDAKESATRAETRAEMLDEEVKSLRAKLEMADKEWAKQTDVIFHPKVESDRKPKRR